MQDLIRCSEQVLTKHGIVLRVSGPIQWNLQSIRTTQGLYAFLRPSTSRVVDQELPV